MSATAAKARAVPASRFFHVHTSAHSSCGITRSVCKINVASNGRTLYDSCVPEKKGNRLGRLNRKKRTCRAMRFFYVCIPLHVSYERRWWGSLRACWFFFFHQSSNPTICCSPRLDAGRGLNAKKEALMPSSTRTPVQSLPESLIRLSGHANTVSALLSVIALLPAAEQQNALVTCVSILADVSRDIEALIGGAA